MIGFLPLRMNDGSKMDQISFEKIKLVFFLYCKNALARVVDPFFSID